LPEWLPQVLDDVWAVHPRASNREAVPRHAPTHTRTHPPTHTHARTHTPRHTSRHMHAHTIPTALRGFQLVLVSALTFRVPKRPKCLRLHARAGMRHSAISHHCTVPAAVQGRSLAVEPAKPEMRARGVRSLACGVWRLCGSGKYQLSVTRAPHPSDIQWENLELSAFGNAVPCHAMPCHAGSTIE
jgi:hypothetical protein